MYSPLLLLRPARCYTGSPPPVNLDVWNCIGRRWALPRRPKKGPVFGYNPRPRAPLAGYGVYLFCRVKFPVARWTSAKSLMFLDSSSPNRFSVMGTDGLQSCPNFWFSPGFISSRRSRLSSRLATAKHIRPFWKSSSSSFAPVSGPL